MGLDMYLMKKTYVGFQARDTLKIEGADEGINPHRVRYIEEEVGYWRKANAIHQWFVDNVQAGADDCHEYYVGREQLEELLGVAREVLDNTKLVEGEVNNGYRLLPSGAREPIVERGKTVEDPSVAQELLPTQSGFFFGGTDYDEYYVDDLKETVRILEDALRTRGDGGVADFYYHSSW